MEIETGIDPLNWTVGFNLGQGEGYIFAVFIGPLYLIAWPK